MKNESVINLAEKNTDKQAPVWQFNRQYQAIIRKLKDTEQELSASLIKEKEINQMKSRFVSMASHEFRSPLSSILLSASLIEKYYDKLDKEKVKVHLSKIKNAITDLTVTLNDFLSVERIESGKVNPVYTEFDLEIFSQDIVEEMQLVAKGGQKILYRHLSKETMACLDKNLLKHCLVNLLSNAIKYSDEFTFIEFQTEVRDRKCFFQVKDHGIGISRENRGLLFEAFFRAENSSDIPGTGLGLNIVDKYTRLMNGTVHLKTKVGAGTVFTLVFPVNNHAIQASSC